VLSRPRRRVGRSCGCLVAVVALVAVLLSIGAIQAFATPDLGAQPGGSNDGETQNAIAARLGTSLIGQFVLRPHAVVSISEHDLTVLVREHNPNPSRFQQPATRVRDGLVVIDARTPAGPFTMWAVARLALSTSTDSSGMPRVSADFRSVQLGSLGLPDVVAHALQDRIQQAFDLQDLLSADPNLKLARQALECVQVSSSAVRIGFHRPDAAGDPHGCG
jgi:hypothetical protein